MEITCSSNCSGGFKREDVITSNNGLALLASLTLKNILKINNNCSSDNRSSSNKHNSEISKKRNNVVIFNHLNNQQQSTDNNNYRNNKNNKNHYSSNQLEHIETTIARGGLYQQPSISIASSSSSTTTTTITVINNKQSSLQQQQQKLTNNPQHVLDVVTLSQQQQQQSSVTSVAKNLKSQQCNGQLSTTTPSSPPLNSEINTTASTTLTSVNVTLTTPKVNKNAATDLWGTLKVSSINENDGNNNNTNNNKNENKNGNVTTVSTPTTVQPSATSTPVSASKYYQIPSDILDDLASRFIINMPDIEQQTVIRMCFQIELAHWFYLDFFCTNDDRKLQPCGIKHFVMQLFEHIPFLRQHLPSLDTILEEWKNYKLSVPTYGAILISEDLNYCLLVQSYFAKSSWGFPKGKVNENEDPIRCAQREVYEETGFDITQLLIPNDFIESVYNYQVTRLYIVQNVPLKTKFIPRTRNEIKSCDWFPIDALPVNKNDAISKVKLGLNANSFFMIIPFIKRLKKWIHDKRNGPGLSTGLSVPNNGDNTVVSVTTAGTVALDNNNDNHSLLSSPSTNNYPSSNNGQEHQQQQSHPKCSTTGKKLKQQRNNNNHNNSSSCNNDDSNHKSVSQNNANNGNGNNGATSVQRALSYTPTNIQQPHHHSKQLVNETNGRNCNNELKQTPTTTATTTTCANKSKRQRHKSMGDLDGIKLSNNNNNNNNNNLIIGHKLNNTNNNNTNNKGITKALNTQKTLETISTTPAAATTTSSNNVASTNNPQQQSTQKKRNSLKHYLTIQSKTTLIASTTTVYDPSTITKQLQQQQSDDNNNDFKRHLSHNQNHQQNPKSEAIDQNLIRSFELIRRGKQQIKTGAEPVATQKQRQQQNNDGRMRTKSQGDNNNKNNNNNNRNNNKNNNNNMINVIRSSKQKVIVNNKYVHHKINIMNGIINNINRNRANSNNTNTKINKTKINGITTITEAKNRDIYRSEVLKTSRILTPTQINEHDSLEFITGTTVDKEQCLHKQQQQQSPFTCGTNNKNIPILVAKCELLDTPKVNLTTDVTQSQRQHIINKKMSITNGANVRILQRSTSHSSATENATQLQQQSQHHNQHRPILEFQPSLNSWTNFTFTKNFISNVFC